MQGTQQIFRLYVPGSEEPVHTLPQHRTSPEVQPKWIVWRSAYDHAPQYSLQLKSQCSFREFFDRPAGHGSVCTDENHAVIISWAKAGDHQNSFLQLPGI